MERENEGDEEQKRLNEVPCNRNEACAEISNALECTYREIDRVPVIAGGTRVCNGHSDRLGVVSVSELDLPSAEDRLDVEGAVPSEVHGGNQVIVTMYCSASTSDIILVKEGGVSTGLTATATGGGY